MENTLRRALRATAVRCAGAPARPDIGAIVMNANPFTLGHRHLVEHAAARCDWLHLFVVREDASSFRSPRVWRWCGPEWHLSNVSVHEGSQYIISAPLRPTS